SPHARGAARASCRLARRRRCSIGLGGARPSRSPARAVQRGQPVDAGTVLLVAVRPPRVRALTLRPSGGLPAGAHERVLGHRVAAGVGDARDGHPDHRAHAVVRRGAPGECVEVGIARHEHAAAATPDDPARPVPVLVEPVHRSDLRAYREFTDYWTSTTVDGISQDALGVTFSNGFFGGSAKSPPFYTRAVRGGS